MITRFPLPLALGVATALAFSPLLPGCGKGDPDSAATNSAMAKQAKTKGADEHGDHEKEGGAIKLSADQIAAAGIKVAPLQQQEIATEIVVTAVIRANQDRIAHVAPRVEGRIIAVSANLGDGVKEGQALATLDSLVLGEAHSAYLQAASAHRVAQADLKRAKVLNVEEIIPHKEFLRAKSAHEKSAAEVRAAEDKLRMLGVPPRKTAATRAVSTFPLIAPFAGTVIEKHAILGELGRPEESLFTVADLSRLWIEADLYEKDLARVATGAEAIVTVAAYPDVSFKGRITYIGAALDKETRTLKARIEMDNADGRLKPEMFATAAIVAGGTGKAFVLPDEALFLLDGKPAVFVAENGSFAPRPVSVGKRLRGQVVIESGVKAGEQVVLAGTYGLKARVLKSQIGEGHAH